ncbi:MAG: FtsH protease activity modulator HflK [Alphaproteobacteria bacterium]
MPWNQGGGGGPWGSGGSGGGGSPWGRGSPPQPPNLEDLLRQGQDRFKRMMPRGGGNSNFILYVGIAIFFLWVASGIYYVPADAQGVVLRFGKWVDTTGPGLHYHLPTPIETVLKPRVLQVNSLDLGFRNLAGGRGPKREVPEESLMLTGDQNIIDIDFNVQWRIKDAGQYLFNIRDPEQTVRVVAESAMREIVGRTGIQPALTEGRRTIETEAFQLMQKILDDYGAGIAITQVQLQEVHPPEPVIDAFNDVQRAIQDRDRMQNEAEAYRNDIIPRARGEAVKLVQDASAYKEKVVLESQGRAQHFLSVYNEYKNAKDVTTKRIYLETMEEILRGTPKYIVNGGREGVAPYLPLPLPQSPAHPPESKKPGAAP